LFCRFWSNPCPKTDIFTALPVRPDQQADTIVVTDSPNLIQNWQLKFDAQQHLEEVIKVYQASFRAGLVEFEKSLERYNPMNILQVRKIDKNGLQQEFDSSSLDNGHIAAHFDMGKP
jgi:glutathionyl-hydroquinone reductase